MSVNTSVLLQCYEQAAAASKGALERCVDQSVTALQDAESKAAKGAGREDFGQAWRELQARKFSWSDRFARDLLAAFKTEGVAASRYREDQSEQAKTPVAKPGSSDLSLADEDQVADEIEATRLLQSILPAVDQPLSELNARISTALGFASVTPEINPLRPEVFTRTLRALVVGSAMAPASATQALRYMAAPLGREIKAIYSTGAALLEQAKIEAAEYRVLLTPGMASAESANAEGSESSGADQKSGDGAPAKAEANGDPAEAAGVHSLKPEQYANFDKLANKKDVIRDFLAARGASQAPQPLAKNYYEAVDKELAAVKARAEPEVEEPPGPAPQYRETPAVERPHRFIDAWSQLSSKVWGAYGRAKERALVHVGLKKEATNTAQVIGLEVVRQVVGHVAQDPRLLAPMREAIVALEPALLRLAMVDPRFLTEAGHPGRRLIESAAQRSFRHNDEFSPEFDAFFRPVADAFKALNRMRAGNPKAFESALNDLTSLWADQDHASQKRSEKVLRTLDAAEGRQAMADQIAQELSLRSDIEGAPGMVLDFIYGPWALVMANARMADPKAPDPGGFGAVVTDLLWSVKLDLALKEPARLLALIPGMLAKLRLGLRELGQRPHESEAFFTGLMRLHQPVIERRFRRSPAEAGNTVLPTPVTPVARPATSEQRKPKAAERPWLGVNEQEVAGFAAPVEAVADAGAQAKAAAPEVGSASVDTAQVLQGLYKGCAVDLYSNAVWVRTQLTWINARRTMFLFLSEGRQAHSMTVRTCEKLIADRHLRLVDTQEVVAQAMEALRR